MAYSNSKEDHRRADVTEEQTVAHRTCSQFLKPEDSPPDQLAPLPILHCSFFGFHSLANRCASAIWAAVILEAA